jgi:hypothetical protein
MKIDESQKPYLLDSSLHNKIYTDIKEQLFSNLGKPPAAENKIAVYLAAQPGSGKTSLRNYLIGELDIANKSIVLNTDELRDYHPFYNALQSDPKLYAKAPYLVNPDASGWYEKLQMEAANSGYNLIIDSTLGGNVDNYAASMNKRLSEGYKPSLHILAINRELSKLGIYLRYENQMKNKGIGRFVSMLSHDTNYNNLVPNIDFLLKNIPWQRVDIFTRHIDENNAGNAVRLMLSSHNAINNTEIINQIKAEHTRHWTDIEKEYLKYRINQVDAMISARNGNPEQFRNDMRDLIQLLEMSS